MAERIKRGMARVQFLAVKEIVQNKLMQGYTVKLIYDELCSEGKIAGSYKSFSRYIKIYELTKINNAKIEQKQPVNSNNQKEQRQEQTPSQKVSFKDGASYSTLIKNTENKEESN